MDILDRLEELCMDEWADSVDRQVVEQRYRPQPTCDCRECD